MHPLNPFLRALFPSTVPGQAVPINSHVLLVPTTDSLLNARDRDTGRRYTELVQEEDFLGSHILRIQSANTGGKDGNNIRESRGKAKSFTTINGRTVIIKENMVYSNKGFKHLTQAQLLNDVLYFSAADAQPWLIYYISKPLIGAFEPNTIMPAAIRNSSARDKEPVSSALTESVNMPKKKDIKTFSDLLNTFPMIARQMQPGLERLLNEFGKELGKPLPPPPSRSSSTSSKKAPPMAVQSNGSIHSAKANSSAKVPLPAIEFFEDEEDLMRHALETAVTAAIDLFQLVDKQQLSFLGATTDLTGPLVERLVEQYVAEQVHDSLLFPRLCAFHRIEDSELDRRIRQMENIDASQVGIAIDGGRDGKEDLISRLNKGVEAFRKMGVAGSPQEMLKILLATEKAVSEAVTSSPSSSEEETRAEKQSAVMTINADILVSLLLIVVIRSQIRHLQARLSYMQRFIFIDDIESGEIGYALSTFEAVLSYLMKDAGGLRRASLQNRRLWDATKGGRVADMKTILESNEPVPDPDDIIDELEDELNGILIGGGPGPSEINSKADDFVFEGLPSEHAVDAPSSVGSSLSHVFPFQSASTAVVSGPASVKSGKRVSIDTRSLSSSSGVSLQSQTTIRSTTSVIEGDTSIESLSQTQDPAGNTIPMMAVEGRQPESLRYLLTLSEYYPPDVILKDTTSEGTTLLSAAIQLAHTELVDIVLDFIEQSVDEQSLIGYLAKPDKRGRTAAHYLFNVPHLMSRLGSKLPWRFKDKIGQTPLFALSRSYDHPNYSAMVSEALTVAMEAQGDGQQLRVEDHTDNRGNTLLHIINDPMITHRILHHCDCDPNAVNDKRFTPLMLASKYGRVDMVRIFFSDPRVDLHLKELRGLTAVELAKDDEVRNRIDDLTLFSNSPSAPTSDPTGRITTVVRSFFVEDGTVRFILKSGAPSNIADPTSKTYTITTSRRTLRDFENLAKWLALEHPASYIPSLSSATYRTPFQIVSKPSRAVLHDIQLTLDRFLKIMLAHPTFSTHEMLWEFFLVPDMQSEQMAARAKLKAQLLSEHIIEENEPVSDITMVESLTAHSREMVRGVNLGTRSVIRRGHHLQHSHGDLIDAMDICSAALSTLGLPAAASLPQAHVEAFARYAALMNTSLDSSPLTAFIQAMTSFQTTVVAIQTSLLRPTNLITQITSTSRALSRHRQNLQSQSLPRKFNFPGLEEGRVKGMRETEKRIAEEEEESVRQGKELRWTQEVVVGELAGWTGWKEGFGRKAIRDFARACIVKERERGKGMERMLRALRERT